MVKSEIVKPAPEVKAEPSIASGIEMVTSTVSNTSEPSISQFLEESNENPFEDDTKLPEPVIGDGPEIMYYSIIPLAINTWFLLD